MRVLVTGGTGFVGAHTVKTLQDAGHEVRLLVRDARRIIPALDPVGAAPAMHVIGDVMDRESVVRAMAGCDAVIHAASVFSNDPRRGKEIEATNLRGAEVVLGAAVEQELDPIVHVSSVVALARKTHDALTEDSAPGKPVGAYAISKLRQEVFARSLQASGAPVVITYPGAVWGPHDPHDGESVVMARRFARGQVPFVPSGSLPVVDVREVAAAHAAVMERGRGPRRYMLGGQTITVAELGRTICRAAGVRRPAIPVPAIVGYATGLVAGRVQPFLPFRLPIEPGTTWFVGLNLRADLGSAERVLGIRFRPPVETLRDQVEWQKAADRL